MKEFSNAEKQVLVTNLARVFSLLSHQHTKDYTLSSPLPLCIFNKFQTDLNTFDRTMGNIIAQGVVNAYEEVIEKSKSPTEAVLKMNRLLYNTGYVYQKSQEADPIQTIDDLINRQWSRLQNILSFQESQYRSYSQLAELEDYTHYLFISEQTKTTCDECNSRHGVVYTKEDLQGLNMIPPIHPNCQCSLIAIDNWLYRVYNRNQKTLLPYITELVGTRDGLFYIDHNAAQMGVNSLTLHPIITESQELITHPAPTNQLQWLEDLKDAFVAWGVKFGQDAVAALDAMIERGQATLQRASTEENILFSLVLYADFFTLGIGSSIWDGITDRFSRMIESPSPFNVLNNLTLGLGDLVDGSFFPDEPFSFEHICNMIGLIALLYGAYRAGETLVDVPERLPGSISWVSSVQQAALNAGDITGAISADDYNAAFLADKPSYYEPPIMPGTQVYEIVTTKDLTFSRVYGENSSIEGKWVMTTADLAGKTAAEIQDVWALPSSNSLTYICDVTIPEGTTLTVSQANGILGHNGGGIQYNLIDDCLEEWFSNQRYLTEE